MAQALVSTPDVVALLPRPLTNDESDTIDWYCMQASAKLRNKRRSIDARIAAWELDQSDPDGIDPDVVAGVLAEAIKRYLVNKTGAASTSDSGAGFAHSESFASYGKSMGGSGAFEITESDLAQLDSAPSSPVRTVRIGATMPVFRHGRRDAFGHRW